MWDTKSHNLMGKLQIPYLQTNLDGSLDKEVVFPRIGFKS
jgi:hypothetical protein